MDTTKNLGLSLPAYDNVADIEVLNENFKKLDDIHGHSYELYVDGAAGAGGDGSEEKPYQTITEAVTAAADYSGFIRIRIKAGTYNEAVTIKDMPQAAVHLMGDGGTVTIGSVKVISVNDFTLTDISFNGTDRAAIGYTNVSTGAINGCTIAGSSSYPAIEYYNSSCFISDLTVNNAAVAINARDNSKISIRGASGIGNAVGIYTAESVINCAEWSLGAETDFIRENGGLITVEGLGSDLPPVSVKSGGTGAAIPREAIKHLHGVSVLARSDMGDSVNIDNPPYNGLFEVRVPEATYTGTLPYAHNYYPVLSMKTPDNIAMLQISGGDSFYIRGAQKNGVTMDGVPWSQILTSDVLAGFVAPYAGDTPPTGWLACDGSTINRTTYSKLFSAIGTKYGAGDGSTTFALPNLNNNSFLEGSGTAGTVKAAGLPNITGSLNNTYNIDTVATGAFTKTSNNNEEVQSNSGYYPTYNINFDASRSSAVYGKSTTVQPKSVTVKFCIKY